MSPKKVHEDNVISNVFVLIDIIGFYGSEIFNSSNKIFSNTKNAWKPKRYAVNHQDAYLLCV